MPYFKPSLKEINQQILEFINDYENVIWDWNCTLIDDVDNAVACSLNPQKTLMIGDTIHDFEVAEKLSFNCLILADGHQSVERVKKVASHVLSGRRDY